MFNKDKWNEIIEVLSANPLRTLITAFGVFWGVFVLVVMLSAGQGLQNGVIRQLGGLSTNTMFIWAESTSKPYKGLPQARRYNFQNSDVEDLKREIKGLLYVSPRNRLGTTNGGNNVSRGIKTGAYRICGDYPEVIQQNPTYVIKGRFINHSDIENKRKVAVIGERVVQELYEPDEEVLGSYIKAEGVNFLVVGVYGNRRTFGDPEEEKKQIFVPFTTFQQAFNFNNFVGWLSITAEDDIPITDLKNSILDLLKKRHNIDPTDQRAIGYFDLYQEFKRVKGLFSILKIISYTVGILILGSGIIGIVNIMLIVVKERTKEIGIRRALGATPWDIRRQILTESAVLSLISGITGIIFAGFVLSLADFALTKIPNSENIPITNPSVNVGLILVALLILVLAGLLAGFIPAQTAVRVKPIDALRTE